MVLLLIVTIVTCILEIRGKYRNVFSKIQYYFRSFAQLTDCVQNKFFGYAVADYILVFHLIFIVHFQKRSQLFPLQR